MIEPAQSYDTFAKSVTDAATTTASLGALWKVVCTFGAGSDYFAYRLLWWLRGSVDWLLGGPSFRRRRRDPQRLCIGDFIDAWRVIDLQPNRKLTLLLEMKLPGAGVLEFDLINRGAHRQVRATAYFQPDRGWGMLYWYPLVPFHFLVFRKMTREVVRRAQQIDRPGMGNIYPDAG